MMKLNIDKIDCGKVTHYTDYNGNTYLRFKIDSQYFEICYYPEFFLIRLFNKSIRYSGSIYLNEKELTISDYMSYKEFSDLIENLLELSDLYYENKRKKQIKDNTEKFFLVN